MLILPDNNMPKHKTGMDKSVIKMQHYLSSIQEISKLIEFFVSFIVHWNNIKQR